MNKFYIEIVASASAMVQIEAEDPTDAMTKADELYKAGKIELILDDIAYSEV